MIELVKLDKINRVKGLKTVVPEPNLQGKYRWSVEYRDGTGMDKYNLDGSKNVYAGREEGKVKVHVPLKGVSKIRLTDIDDNIVAEMDVPVDAIVFQRRRVRDINYFNRFHDVSLEVPDQMVDGHLIPKHIVVKHNVPEWTFGECWLIGYRMRGQNGKIEVKTKVVYPASSDGTIPAGKVDEFNGWKGNGHSKPWVKEPDWFEDELVDADDKVEQLDRMAVKFKKPKEELGKRLGWTV